MARVWKLSQLPSAVVGALAHSCVVTAHTGGETSMAVVGGSVVVYERLGGMGRGEVYMAIENL